MAKGCTHVSHTKAIGEHQPTSSQPDATAMNPWIRIIWDGKGMTRLGILTSIQPDVCYATENSTHMPLTSRWELLGITNNLPIQGTGKTDDDNPVIIYLFPTNNSSDKWHTFRLIGCFQGNLVNVVDKLLTVDWTGGFPFTVIVGALIRRHKSVL